jgi:hypothetical protein
MMQKLRNSVRSNAAYALENLDDNVNVNRAWENIIEDIKI